MAIKLEEIADKTTQEQVWRAMIKGKLFDQTPIPVYSRTEGWHTSCADKTNERE